MTSRLVPQVRCALEGSDLVLQEYSRRPLLPLSALVGTLPRGLRVFLGPDRQPYVGPEHFVGLLTIKCATCQESHLLILLPKGVDDADPEKVRRGLFHFMELLALVNGEKVGDERAWRSDVGLGTAFLLLLCGHYATLLRELCRADFRRFYRHESDQLTGRIRGRLLVPRHLANSLRGAAHRVPCEWEEFTADNLENRILKQAHLALVRSALQLNASEGAKWIHSLFRGVRTYFDEVTDTPVTIADLHRTRLDRLSSHYRRSLRWARLILRGTRNVRAADEAPQLLIDANSAFEELARLIIRRAIPRDLRLMGAGTHLETTLLVGGPEAKPDLLIKSRNGTIAVGDAKYKKVLELADAANAATDNFEAVQRIRLRADDLYQLYAYQRITQAPLGFLVVPYWSWDQNSPAAELHTDEQFTRSPIDGAAAREGDHSVAVLGLNMAMRPLEVVNEAVSIFRRWIVENRAM